ncbi:MAG: SIMPL domain-containing protein [Devosia sp.]|nr:SIMPL domain-containing protein [Devosia sp.]
MRLLPALVPLALCTALTFPALAHDAAPGTISIEGRGEVMAAPDTAFVTSGVTSQGATARAALDANTLAMNELIATLKAAGIEARDIQTSGFSVNPNYVYTDARGENGYTLPPKINGYQVYNTVTVRVRDLPALGSVLDKAVTVGANTINGVSFSVSDPSRLYDEARKAAFADARDKAETYAGAAGIDLGSIRLISESQGYGQPQPYALQTAMYDRAASSPVPVEAGELTFSVNVSVTWELGDSD